MKCKEEIASSLGLCFAPGLLEVLQAGAPPTVPYLKSSPVNFIAKWGVYILLLEKPYCRYKVYIGSGTAHHDLSIRVANYKKAESLPKYIEEAYADGYALMHCEMLCWTPMPSINQMTIARPFFLALDGAFSFLFWTMHPEYDSMEDMFHFCPWASEALWYDGLCSHSSFAEGFRLAAEDLEERVARRAETHRVYERERKKREKKKDPVGYAVKRETQSERSWTRSAEKSKGSTVPCAATPRKVGSFEGSSSYPKHQKMLALSTLDGDDEREEAVEAEKEGRRQYALQHMKDNAAEWKAEKKFFCEPCDHAFRCKRDLKSPENDQACSANSSCRYARY